MEKERKALTMRLIDADALMDKACENLRDSDVLDRIPPSFIDNAPTVDAVPVMHGVWEFPILQDEDENDPRCKCSECGSIETPLARHRYCPNCGAKMDKVGG